MGAAFPLHSHVLTANLSTWMWLQPKPSTEAAPQLEALLRFPDGGLNTKMIQVSVRADCVDTRPLLRTPVFHCRMPSWPQWWNCFNSLRMFTNMAWHSPS